MSSYEQYQTEKHKLDTFIAQQFRITGMQENLSGAWLTLEHPGGEQATLHLETADARKYCISVLLKQQRPTSE